MNLVRIDPPHLYLLACTFRRASKWLTLVPIKNDIRPLPMAALLPAFVRPENQNQET